MSKKKVIGHIGKRPKVKSVLCLLNIAPVITIFFLSARQVVEPKISNLFHFVH